MADFDRALNTTSLAMLKRELTDDERAEFLDLVGVLGVKDVEDYLYMLMLFKRHEDRLSAKFDELTELENKINETLEVSVERILGDGAARIGMDMGGHIAEMARETLGARDDYQFLRGHLRAVCFVSIISAAAYWLGSVNALSAGDSMAAVDALFMFPVGWWAFFCCSLHTFMWSYDHWEQVKRSIFYKSVFAAQCLILAALFAYVFAVTMSG